MLKKNILIVVKGYTNENFKKQPWFWLNSFIDKKLKNKFNINILTDKSSIKNSQFNIIINPNYFKNYDSYVINFYKPHIVYFLANPASLIFFSRYRKLKNLHFIFAVPRFYLRNLLKLTIGKFWIERKLIFLPVISSIIPFFIIKFFFNLTKAKKIIHLSKSSFEIYRINGFDKFSFHYENILKFNSTKKNKKGSVKSIDISYFGPPLFSRGIDYVLDSFNRIDIHSLCKPNLQIRLIFYLRIGNDIDFYSKSLEKLLQLIKKSKNRNNIHISTKYLSDNQIVSSMKKSKVVILPFKITISDLPIVVYEAGMFAENMIVLDTNGVSEIANKFKGYVAKDSDEIFYYLKKILTKNYDEL